MQANPVIHVVILKNDIIIIIGFVGADGRQKFRKVPSRI